MFIVWGTKVIHKKLGRVADYCFICRDVRPFRGTRIESVGHLYFIPIGKRTTHGHHRACEECGSKFTMDPEAYQGFSRDRHADLDGLVADTQPHIFTEYKERLEDAKRIRDGRLPAEKRMGYIREAFVLLSHRVEAHGSSMHVDREVALSIVGSIVGPWGAIAVLYTLFPPPSDVAIWGAIGVGVVGFVAICWAAVTQRRRFARRRVLPVVFETLRPLAPTADELREVVLECKQADLSIGKNLRPDDVLNAFGWDNSKTRDPEFAT